MLPSLGKSQSRKLIMEALLGLFLALQKNSGWLTFGRGNRIAEYLNPFLAVLLSIWDHKC